MSKTVCVINDYYNSPLVYKAINSAKDQVDEIVVVGSSSRDLEIAEEKVTFIQSNVSDVGKRYFIGLEKIDADYYFLLDYDDLFLSNKVETLKGVFENERGSAVKESETYNPSLDYISNVIRNRIDWHISEYSFNADFKEYLLKFVKKYAIPTHVSFDKILFAIMLNYGNIHVIASKLTEIVSHNDSRMHAKRKRNFYSETYKVFEKFKSIPDLNLNCRQYVEYTYDLNRYLSEPTKENYKNLSAFGRYPIPLYKRLYYRYYSIVKPE